MDSSVSYTSDAVGSSHSAADVRLLFAVEFLSSCGANFLQVGIFFYMRTRFGWSLRSNFLLAAAQGVSYVLGAMNADRLTRVLSHRGALTLLYLCMSVVTFVGTMLPYSAVLAVLLPVYTGIAAMTWPILESLLSAGVASEGLSRRIGIYNLVWSGSGALVLALNGTIIEHFVGGVFALPTIFHGMSMVLVRISARNVTQPLPAAAASAKHAGAHPEPELLRLGTTALWLSRVALPATYVLIYGLMALMPSLTVLKPLDTARQTLVSSTWMVTRLLMFVVLGAGTWWHTRPRLLIAAAWLMLLAFLGTVVRPSDVLGHGTQATDLVAMLLAQVLLGGAIGLIYAASLYFGMVLSQGSTEHGGYHEALIGLGSILGPGFGAAAQWCWPGNVRAGIIAVGSVVAASVVAVSATSLVIRASHQKRGKKL